MNFHGFGTPGRLHLSMRGRHYGSVALSLVQSTDSRIRGLCGAAYSEVFVEPSDQSWRAGRDVVHFSELAPHAVSQPFERSIAENRRGSRITKTMGQLAAVDLKCAPGVSLAGLRAAFHAAASAFPGGTAGAADPMCSRW